MKKNKTKRPRYKLKANQPRIKNKEPWTSLKRKKGKKEKKRLKKRRNVKKSGLKGTKMIRFPVSAQYSHCLYSIVYCPSVFCN